jgi:hypothetical protein
MIIDQLPSSSPLPLPIPKQPTIQQSLPRQRTMGVCTIKGVISIFERHNPNPNPFTSFCRKKRRTKTGGEGL